MKIVEERQYLSTFEKIKFSCAVTTSGLMKFNDVCKAEYARTGEIFSPFSSWISSNELFSRDNTDATISSWSLVTNSGSSSVTHFWISTEVKSFEHNVRYVFQSYLQFGLTEYKFEGVDCSITQTFILQMICDVYQFQPDGYITLLTS